MDFFRNWLREALERNGKSQSDLARHWGKPANYVTKIWSEGRKISLPEFMSAVEFLGESPVSLPQPEVRELRRVSLEDEAREEEEELARRNAGGYGTAGEFRPSMEGGIPEVDVLAGAGDGVVGEVVNLRIGANTVSGHKVLEEWKMPAAYLSAELRVSPHRSLIMPVVGDSMIPTYQPGDRILLDLNQSEMTVDAVYVISDGQSPPQIKRLQRVLFSDPHMVDIISDNAAHPPQRVELALLTIIGRVAGKMSKQ